MNNVATRCPRCHAFQVTNICPVCGPPTHPRSALIGVALLGLVAGGLAVAAWVGVLCWKWHRWLAQFGHTGEPPEQADAQAMAFAVGLLLFAVVSVGSMVLIAWTGRK